MEEVYNKGFLDKCAEIGIDPESLVKSAADPISSIARVGKHITTPLFRGNAMMHTGHQVADPAHAFESSNQLQSGQHVADTGYHGAEFKEMGEETSKRISKAKGAGGRFNRFATGVENRVGGAVNRGKQAIQAGASKLPGAGRISALGNSASGMASKIPQAIRSVPGGGRVLAGTKAVAKAGPMWAAGNAFQAGQMAFQDPNTGQLNRNVGSNLRANTAVQNDKLSGMGSGVGGALRRGAYGAINAPRVIAATGTNLAELGGLYHEQAVGAMKGDPAWKYKMQKAEQDRLAKPVNPQQQVDTTITNTSRPGAASAQSPAFGSSAVKATPTIQMPWMNQPTTTQAPKPPVGPALKYKLNV